MSWLFINAQDKAAVRRREEALAKMDAWWEAFRGKADDLDALFHGRKEWNLPAWMNRHLQAIDERLMWEFGPNHAKGGHQLVITPESHKELRPLVQTLLERAPKIAGWSFSPYRVAEETDIARQIVEARTGTALPERFSVRASAGEMNRIDLVVESPAFPKSGKQQALHQSFVAVETMLGEETLDKWIGTIDVERSRPGRYSLPPDRLKPTVEALIGSFRDQLPPQPLHAEPPPEQGSVIKLQPEKQPDYAGKEDMLVASTMQPQILLASLNDVTFYSERFSRHGERFAYLKIDGSEGAGKFADRTAIEEAIDSALRPNAAGCVLGGGTGLRYSYIDLAINNVEDTAKRLREVLREGQISTRSWLLFCDCEWRNEWIGFWDETPAPPRTE